MLIAQISDLHIGADDDNLSRLDAVLDQLEAMPARPDHLLVTGDLTEHGDETSSLLLARECH